MVYLARDSCFHKKTSLTGLKKNGWINFEMLPRHWISVVGLPIAFRRELFIPKTWQKCSLILREIEIVLYGCQIPNEPNQINSLCIHSIYLVWMKHRRIIFRNAEAWLESTLQDVNGNFMAPISWHLRHYVSIVWNIDLLNVTWTEPCLYLFHHHGFFHDSDL